MKDVWVDALSVFFHPDDIRDHRYQAQFETPEVIGGEIDSFLFPGLMSIRVIGSGQRFERGTADAVRGGVDGLVLQAYAFGENHCETGHGRQSHLHAGDIHFLDMSQQTVAHSTAFTNYNLVIPRATLTAANIDMNVDDLHLHRIAAGQVMAKLLHRHLVDLHTMAAQMSFTEAQALVEPTLALVRASLVATPDNLTQAAPLIDRNLLLEMRRFIDRNLFASELSPDVVARSLNMSRATLYRLAAPLGGIHRLIVSRRLRHAFQHLAGGGTDHRSLAQLAFDLGFNSEATFRRSFKTAFGMAPGDVRDRGARAYLDYHATVQSRQLAMRSTNCADAMPLGDQMYRQWIANLFS